MLALEASTHVMCERPLALTVEQADAMIALAKARNVLIVANLMQRYNPLIDAINRLIESKPLGEVLHGSFENYAADEHLPAEHWFWDRAKSGGIFIEHGVHFFDLFECWLGPGRIVAAQQAVRPGTDFREQVQCAVRYNGDVLVNMYHGFHQPSRMDRQKFRLLFERGEVTLYEWVPTRLGIHAIADEAATRTLCDLFPGARLDVTNVYDGRQRRCRGRHQAIDFWQMLDLTVGEGIAKYHRYGELLRVHDARSGCLDTRFRPSSESHETQRPGFFGDGYRSRSGNIRLSVKASRRLCLRIAPTAGGSEKGQRIAIMAKRRQIVILGGGFAGAYCAQALKKSLRGIDAEVLLIDRNNYFVFYPLLIEAGTGSLEPRHAVVPMRAFLRSADFRMAEVSDIDFERQAVSYQLVGGESKEQIRYDHLVISVGSVTRLPEVPGLREYGYEMKSLADAVALRDRAISMLELADATADTAKRRALLHFVVVGGNFTGVEVAGEFDVFLRHGSRRYLHVNETDVTITLIELGDRILTALDPDLSQYAAAHLRNRGVNLLLNNTVTAIERDRVSLSTGDALSARTVIWCAGIEQNPIVRGWSLPVDERGYILCEHNLRVKGFDNVWAVGDCAVNPDPDGYAYPATAQHAVRQGAHLARNLAAVLKGAQPRPCHIKTRGALAALGCRTGVAKVYGIKLSGFTAWWLWRTVYLLKMPTLARKVRVALDWTVDLVFSRDYVQLGVHRVSDRR